MTTAQLKVIFALLIAGEVANSRLAEMLSIGHATPPHLVAKLAPTGFVERSEHPIDCRSIPVRLVNQSMLMLRHLREGRLDSFGLWLILLDEQDMLALRAPKCVRQATPLQRAKNHMQMIPIPNARARKLEENFSFSCPQEPNDVPMTVCPVVHLRKEKSTWQSMFF